MSQMLSLTVFVRRRGGRFLAVVGASLLSAGRAFAARQEGDVLEATLEPLLLFFVVALALTALFLFGRLGKIARRNEELETQHEAMTAETADLKSRYEGLVENIPIAVAVVDRDFRIQFMNKKMQALFPHVNPAERKKCHHAFNDPPVDSPCWRCPTISTFKEGQTHQRILEKQINGEPALIRMVSSPIRDRMGNVTAAIEIYEDITEYKSAEVALEEQLSFMETLLDVTPMPVYYKDDAGVFQRCNSAFEQYVDTPREKIIGKTVKDVLMRGTSTIHQEKDEEVYRTGRPVVYEVDFEHVTGERRHAQFHKAPLFRRSGKIAGLICAIVDLTEYMTMLDALGKAEEQYRTIFENAPLGIFRADTSGRFVEANAAMAAMFGYESAEEMVRQVKNIGQDLYVHSERREKIMAMLRKRGRKVSTFENLYKSKNGEEFVANLHVRIVYDENEAPLFVDGMVEDITDRKTAENALRRAKLQAEEASRLKSRFLSSVSHELRTPLTSVLGHAKMAHKKFQSTLLPALPKEAEAVGKAATRVSENFDVVVNEAARLSQLIENVLELAEIESSRTEWRMERVAVHELVELAGYDLKLEITNKGLEYHEDIQFDLPDIRGDKPRLKQVLQRYLQNALDKTESGSITIRAEQDSNTQQVRIGVIDTGPGVSEEVMDGLFEVYGHLEDVMSDTPRAPGMGLSICRRIVEEHGGRTWVESAPDRGAAFWVVIPIA